MNTCNKHLRPTRVSVCEVFAVDGRDAGGDVVLVEHVGQGTGLSLERRGWGCANGVTTHRQVLFIRGGTAKVK